LCCQISIQTVKYQAGNSSQCDPPHPVRRVEAECQGRQTCSLTVNTNNLLADRDDPCPLTTKHLTITHQCRPSSLRTRTTCPGPAASNLALSCSHLQHTELFVMLSSGSSDRKTFIRYCGHHQLHQAEVGEVSGETESSKSSDSSLTRLVVAACHGLRECEVTLPSHLLVRTVYSCVTRGVINMEQIKLYRTTTTTTPPTTTTTTTTTTTSTTELTSRDTTRTTYIDFTSFKTFIPTDNKIITESLPNDQRHVQVQSHPDNRTSDPVAGTRDSLISDISKVDQYRHVISEDINLDILPLEQDITDGSHSDTFIQNEFGTLLVLSCCLVMVVVLVSVILVITIRVLHKASNHPGDSDSTYSPASERVDTEAFSEGSVRTSLYSPQSDTPVCHHLELYNSLSSPHSPGTEFTNSQIYGTVGRKIKPPSIITEESLAYQSNYF